TAEATTKKTNNWDKRSSYCHHPSYARLGMARPCCQHRLGNKQYQKTLDSRVRPPSQMIEPSAIDSRTGAHIRKRGFFDARSMGAGGPAALPNGSADREISIGSMPWMPLSPVPSTLNQIFR